jgi:hypothetical protein
MGQLPEVFDGDFRIVAADVLPKPGRSLTCYEPAWKTYTGQLRASKIRWRYHQAKLNGSSQSVDSVSTPARLTHYATINRLVE